MIRFQTLTLTLFTLSILLTPSLSIYNTTVCTSAQYFDTTALNCATCPSNSVPTDDEISCTCAAGYRSPNLGQGSWTGDCEQCDSANNFVPSADLTRCVQCPVANYDATRRECICDDDSIAIDVDLDGSSRTVIQCVQCGADSYPAPHLR